MDDESPHKRQRCCGDIGCLRSCLGKVNKDVREKLCNRVTHLIRRGSKESYSFIRQYMRGREVNEIRNLPGRHHRRSVMWQYCIPATVDSDEEEMVEVCQIAFKQIFGVTERFIRTARGKEASRLKYQRISIGDTLPAHQSSDEPDSRSELLHAYIPQEQSSQEDFFDDEEEPPAKEIEENRDEPDSRSPLLHENQCTDLTQFRAVFNWSAYQITDKTLENLFDEGFTSLLALSAIREEDLKYLRKSTGIKLGQIALLRLFVESLKCKAHHQSHDGGDTSLPTKSSDSRCTMCDAKCTACEEG